MKYPFPLFYEYFAYGWIFEPDKLDREALDIGDVKIGEIDSIRKCKGVKD